MCVPVGLFVWVALPIDGSAAGSRQHDCIVRDWKIAPRLAGRQPLAPGREFGPGTARVYAYAALYCPTFRGPAAFRFFHEKSRYADITVRVKPSDKWRTWASVRALPGKWRVQLLVSGERVLEDSFVVRR